MFVGRKLGVALKDDHIQDRIAHPLIGDLADFVPAPLAGELAKKDLVRRQGAVFSLELIAGHKALDQLAVQADVALPFLQQVDPVVEGGDTGHGRLRCVTVLLQIVKTLLY